MSLLDDVDDAALVLRDVGVPPTVSALLIASHMLSNGPPEHWYRKTDPSVGGRIHHDDAGDLKDAAEKRARRATKSRLRREQQENGRRRRATR